jgi:hypothetical protein
MPSRILCTLDPHRLGAGLLLDQGNLVVTCAGSDISYPANVNRSAFGTIAVGAGTVSFECYFYSTLRNSLSNLAAVGVAENTCSLSAYVGSSALSWGYFPANGEIRNNGVAINDSSSPEVKPAAERQCISVLLVQGAAPYAVWMVDGNVVFQANLTPGKFYVPAVSLGATVAGDVSACFNFGGDHLFDFPNFVVDAGSAGLQTVHAPGWSEKNSEGRGTAYLALTEEGITTGPNDTPANQQFRPRIKNWDSFSIRRAPQVWMWQRGGVQTQQAAYGRLEIDNYDGAYNWLLDVDWRDSDAILKLPNATALTTGTQIRDTPTFATCVFDDVELADDDTIIVTLKDTLARLDRPLPCRFNPPFAESNASNAMIPLTFGGVRNRTPQLINSPDRIWRLHDANVPNVTLAADMAAPLDPHASPPQYTPALSGSGLQLETMPVGKFTVDCSSYGTQATISGADDVLDGIGEFPHNSSGGWSGTNGAPTGFTWSNGAGSFISEQNGAIYGGVNAARLHSAIILNPGTTYGDQLYLSTATLLGGRTYRLSFKLYDVQSDVPYFTTGFKGGVVVATALSNAAQDYITPPTQPLTTPAFGSLSYNFEFTVPSGAARSLYFIVTPSSGNALNTASGTVSATLFDIKVELLGQYTELPFVGFPLEDYYTEILVNRAGEAVTIFNAADAATIGVRNDGTRMPWGIAFDSPPNILSALREPLDSLGNPCAALFTDNTGQIRIGSLVNPKDPKNRPAVKFDITPFNADRPISLRVDKAPGLTTSGGCRRNWSDFGSSDFVTDQSIVPQDIKARFMRKSQFLRTASVSPAAQYSFAISATGFDTLLDEADDLQNYLLDPAVKFYSPQIFSDGTIDNGVRQLIQVTVYFDDLTRLGVTTQCAVTDVGFGDICQLTYPAANDDPWFEAEYCAVVAWEIFTNRVVFALEV